MCDGCYVRIMPLNKTWLYQPSNNRGYLRERRSRLHYLCVILFSYHYIISEGTLLFCHNQNWLMTVKFCRHIQKLNIWI